METLVQQVRALPARYKEALLQQMLLHTDGLTTVERNVHMLFAIQLAAEIQLACSQLGLDIRAVPFQLDTELDAAIAGHMKRLTLDGSDPEKTRRAYESLFRTVSLRSIDCFETLLKLPFSEITIDELIKSLRDLRDSDAAAQRLLESANQSGSWKTDKGFVLVGRLAVRNICDSVAGMLSLSFEPALCELLKEDDAASELEPFLQSAANAVVGENPGDTGIVGKALMIYFKEMAALTTSLVNGIAYVGGVGAYECKCHGPCNCG